LKRKYKKRGSLVAPEKALRRLPLVEAERDLRFYLGRKTEDAFFWVEWDRASKRPLEGDAVLVLAERRR
jgi:hypothetical protein